MYKLLIVDDEPIIRRGISSSINWKELDIQIVGEAANGKEALEIVRKTYPDIIFIDIKMPIIDGLELSKELEATFPKIKKVVLSAYNDFEYAKKSISYNVKEYLLKPVGAEQLMEVVSKLISEIKDEEEQEERRLKTNDLISQSRFYIQSDLLKKLIKAKADDKNYVLQELENINIFLNGPFYNVLIIEIDDYSKIVQNKDYKEREEFESNIRMKLQSKMNLLMDGYIGLINDSRYLAIINTKNDDTVELKKSLQDLIDYLKNNYELIVSITLSKTIDNLNELSDMYKRTIDASLYKIYFDKSSIIMPEDYINILSKNKSEDKLPYTYEVENKITELILKSDKAELSLQIHDLFAEFRNSYTSNDKVIRIVIRIVTVANHLLDYRGDQIDVFLNRNIIEELHQLRDSNEIREWLIEYLNECLAIKSRNKKFSKEINEAIEYIKNNYSENISLDIVANKVFLSSSYLSRLFKEETGYNFADFINRERIYHAEKLLLQGKKAYEVTELVGFNDYKYFSRVFKKIKGISPRDWVKNK